MKLKLYIYIYIYIHTDRESFFLSGGPNMERFGWAYRFLPASQSHTVYGFMELGVLGFSVQGLRAYGSLFGRFGVYCLGV